MHWCRTGHKLLPELVINRINDNLVVIYVLTSNNASANYMLLDPHFVDIDGPACLDSGGSICQCTKLAQSSFTSVITAGLSVHSCRYRAEDYSTRIEWTSAEQLPWNLQYKSHQITKVKCFPPRPAVVFSQSTKPGAKSRMKM